MEVHGDQPPLGGVRTTSTSAFASLVLKGVVTLIVAFAPLLAVFVGPVLVRTMAPALGWTLRKKTEGRRQQLLALMADDEEKLAEERRRNPELKGTLGRKVATEASSLGITDGTSPATRKDWDGIVGFFHPFCNAGGGGERVLWAAIRATQLQYPKAKCIVYTGDHDVNKEQILTRVKNRFNISLHPPSVQFLYLSKRHWVLSSTWPRFTLIGQSLGSMVLAWDAFSLLVPDIFVDTMGYVFALGLSKLLFPRVPTGAYVHYPTISTDMLDSLDPSSAVGGQGVNAGQGVGLRGGVKKRYWQLFATLYSWVGSTIDVVMTNSTWTQGHIRALWGPLRGDKDKDHPIAILYPPCAVEEMEQEVPVDEDSEKRREPVIVCIAQFRPEKNHQLIVQSFADFVHSGTPASRDARLALIGSVRDDHDSKRVYQLRLLVNELHIKDRVDFQLDAPWPDILEWLRRSSVGVNGMWNEHFGIGVVEYQAAGLISVVHNSGGPKLDIVVDVEGEPTGFHATTAEEFAEGYEKALSTPDPLMMRLRARKSAQRFTEEQFARGWLVELDRLISLAT